MLPLAIFNHGHCAVLTLWYRMKVFFFNIFISTHRLLYHSRTISYFHRKQRIALIRWFSLSTHLRTIPVLILTTAPSPRIPIPSGVKQSSLPTPPPPPLALSAKSLVLCYSTLPFPTLHHYFICLYSENILFARISGYYLGIALGEGISVEQAQSTDQRLQHTLVIEVRIFFCSGRGSVGYALYLKV